uniref:DUF4118 domain-containing protein n=1 Tax=Phenylobacterium sp. TaxID=1871053 RepID=UPI0035AF6F76
MARDRKVRPGLQRLGSQRSGPQGWWRYVAALGFVAASTGVAEIIYRAFDTDRLSMVFLAGVLGSAVVLGPGPAYFAAGAAFVVYDIYLVQPRGTFTLTSAEDVMVLVAFLSVAVLTGGLAGRLRDAQRRAEARARISGALFRASEEFSASDDEDAVRRALAQRIADAGRPAVVLYDGRAWAPPGGQPPPEEVLRLAAESAASASTIQAGDWRLRPLRAEGQ